MIGVCVDLVLYIRILQLGLQHEWLRIVKNVRRPQRSIDQQLVDGPPRLVIPNRQGGVQSDALLLCLQAEVGHKAAEHHRIRYRDLFVLNRPHVFGQVGEYRLSQGDQRVDQVPQ